MNTLKDILKLYKISNGELAQYLNLSEGTTSLKVNKKATFNVEEAKKIKLLIKEKTGKDIPLDFLFIDN